MIKYLGYDAKGTESPVVAVFEVNGERVEVDVNDTTTINNYLALISIIESAETAAYQIPNWATWTEAQAGAWFQANISDPIDNAPTVTSANVVAVVQNIITVLGYMANMLWALARMVIALRNETWPNLEGS